MKIADSRHHVGSCSSIYINNLCCLALLAEKPRKTPFATRAAMLASGTLEEENRVSELRMGQFGSKGGLRRTVPLKKEPTVDLARATAASVAKKTAQADLSLKRS
jgi:hypothetical protein